MSRIAYITNGSSYSGVGHRAHAIVSILKEQYAAEVQPSEFRLDGQTRSLAVDGQQLFEFSSWPGLLNAKSVQWVRLGTRLVQYVRDKNSPDFGLYHLTNQTLSFLAGKLSPSVVTVHDIIELLDPQDKQAYLINRYLYSGIARANQIICVSDYTKKAVQDRYDIPDERITVIYNGVGREFFPIENFSNTVGYQQLRKRLQLETQAGPIILYVGSDHVRKNLVTAVEAFSRIRKAFPNAVFVKVGAPGIASGRELLLRTIDRLQLREAIRIINSPLSNQELNEFFNLADMFVFPSTHEGFGLPPLQAMAAGTPVICSNTTSLPEVVGSAALTHDPLDVAVLSEHMQHVLQDSKLVDELRSQGLVRAKMFSWDTAAKQELEVYKRLI
ncbi:MAG: glycosyltransferase family 1 protein [Candidatus Andersenbacteria bacterium]